MALLTKLKSATLVEALIATLLIVVVFAIASMVLNNLLLNAFSKNTRAIENRLTELEYSKQHNALTLPYREEFNNWSIEITKEESGENFWLQSSAINRDTKKEIIKNRLCAPQD